MNSQEVSAFLISEGLSTLRSVAHEPGDGFGQFFVFLTVTRNRKNRQHPSNLTLSNIRTKALLNRVDIQFLLSIDGEIDIEANLRATLTANYEQYVRTAYSSIYKKKIYVWIDQKRPIPKDVLASITRAIEGLLEPDQLALESVSTLQNSNIPSKLALLSSIRQLAPVTVEEIGTVLQKRNFVLPSNDWLNHQLDKLRRNQTLIRSKAGRYSLSTQAIKSLGTTKNRKSPDISRLLALARSTN